MYIHYVHTLRTYITYIHYVHTLRTYITYIHYVHTLRTYITYIPTYITLHYIPFHYITLHYMPACLHTYIPRYLHAYLTTYLPTYLPACMHTYIHTQTDIHTYLPTYLPTYLRTYAHTYVHTYIHQTRISTGSQTRHNFTEKAEAIKPPWIKKEKRGHVRNEFARRRAPSRMRISTAFGNQHFANTPHTYIILTHTYV